MSVYVDDMYRFEMGEFRTRSGRVYKMSHMIADTHAELVAMAKRIGVARKWIQKAGTRDEHFDITMSKRREAVEAGAIEMEMRDLVQFWHERDVDTYFGRTHA